MDGGRLFIGFLIAFFVALAAIGIFGDLVFEFVQNQWNRGKFRLAFRLWPEHQDAQKTVEHVLRIMAYQLQKSHEDEQAFFDEDGILDAPDLLKRLDAVLMAQALSEHQFREAQTIARKCNTLVFTDYREYLKPHDGYSHTESS